MGMWARTLNCHEASRLTSEILRGACYVFAASLCFFAAGIEWGERRARPRTPKVWVCLGALMLAIAAAEWWNFGRAIADAGRSEAQSGGWYGERRPVQAAVIFGVLVAIPAAWLLVSARAGRRYRRYLPVATMGAAVLGLVLVRGISLHSLDEAFNREVIGPMRAGDMLEVVGAMAIALGALVQVIVRPPAVRKQDVPPSRSNRPRVQIRAAARSARIVPASRRASARMVSVGFT